MQTKKIELSATVNIALNNIARRTDDLLSDECIKMLKRYNESTTLVPLKSTKLSKERFQKLVEQIPEGIWITIKQILNYAETTKNKNKIDSVTHSPLVLTYSDFKCCKIMKYQKGHIITGRDTEIEKILLTLCKSSKRGTILVGEPGTGKTAIVNAINARLIERVVPRQLIGAQILNLDIPYIFTKYKEDPIGTIIKVLERASTYDKAILFIDEVHQLLGHKMNDIMKPYLTEQIRFIGSTTINEYHTIITDDTALERRFTVINVLEPNIEQTISMINGTKSILEDEHNCVIPEDITKYIVVNGSRFLGHRKNPDKSLDILDIACAIMNEKEVSMDITKSEISNDYMKDLENNRNEINSCKLISGNRVLTKDYADLAISSVTNIPFGRIKNSLDYKMILNILENKIFGQKEAIRSLANVVNIFKHVKHDRERPISVLLLVGPSGTGKKSSAKILANSLYGTESAYIEYDMTGMTSEFMITELKGAPPGYVGYGKSGGLIKAIRNNPQSIVYFKGINKADESIIQYIIDASRHGKILDSAEREASLNNTVIIFGITLNDEETNKVYNDNSKSMGFSSSIKNSNEQHKGEINQNELKRIVGENLLKTVDEIVIFNKLKEEDLLKIFNANLQQNLEMYDIDIDKNNLQLNVLSNSKNGHDVISKLTSEIPKLVFQILKQE